MTKKEKLRQRVDEDGTIKGPSTMVAAAERKTGCLDDPSGTGSVSDGVASDSVKPYVDTNAKASPSQSSGSGGRLEFANTSNQGDKKRSSSIENAAVIPLSRRIYEPNPNDVLFGRGRPYQLHPGNIRFQKLLRMHRENYLKSKRQQKQTIIKTVIYMVKQMSGRFLKQAGPEQDFWVEQSDEAAMDKVSHALRSKYYQERDETKPSATTEVPVAASASLTSVSQSQQEVQQPQQQLLQPQQQLLQQQQQAAVVAAAAAALQEQQQQLQQQQQQQQLAQQGLSVLFPLPGVTIPSLTHLGLAGVVPVVPLANLASLQLPNQPRLDAPLPTVSQLLAARSLGIDLAQIQHLVNADPAILSLLGLLPDGANSSRPS